MGSPSTTTDGNSVRTTDLIQALSQRYRVPLRRFFEKRAAQVDAADIEDLVQEVFLRLAGNRDIGSIGQMEGYLFQTAANLLKDRQRRLAARAFAAHEPYDETVHGCAKGAPGPEQSLQGKQLVGQLVAALYELPERTRAVFALYHFENLSHAQIARQLGIAVSTIEKHMARAGAHLLKRMGRLP